MNLFSPKIIIIIIIIIIWQVVITSITTATDVVNYFSDC